MVKSDGEDILFGRTAEDEERTKEIETQIGISKAVQNGSEKFGFLCDVCERSFTDNKSYLVHLNSKGHLANIGKGLNVKKSTLQEVMNRLNYHTTLYLEKLASKERDEVKSLSFSNKAAILKRNLDKDRQERRKVKKMKKATKKSESYFDDEMFAILGFGSLKVPNK